MICENFFHFDSGFFPLANPVKVFRIINEENYFPYKGIIFKMSNKVLLNSDKYQINRLLA